MNNGCLELYNSFTEVVRLEKPGAGIEADDAATDMKVVIGSVSALVASFTYQHEAEFAEDEPPGQDAGDPRGRHHRTKNSERASSVVPLDALGGF